MAGRKLDDRLCTPAAAVGLLRRAAVLSLAAGIFSSCGDGTEDSCRGLLEAGLHDRAAAVCEAAFEAGDGADAGFFSASAQLALGNEEEVIAWTERLADTPRQADALRLASTVRRRRGEVDAARSALERALALDREAGPSGGKTREAWTLNNLARLEWVETRYRRALSFAMEAADAARREQDPHRERLAVELQQGVLSAVGDLRGAREVQDLRETLTVGEDARERAYSLAQGGELWLESGRPDLARDASLRAIATADESGDVENVLYRSAYLNLVEVALSTGDLEDAGRRLDAAWSYAEPDGGRRTALLFYRARLALAEDRWDDAARDLETALAESPAVDWTGILRQLLGRVEEARGETAAAEAAYRAAAAEVEAMHHDLALDALKPWLLEKKRAPFEALFRLLQRQGRVDEALETAERARARTFLDALVRALDRPENSASAEPKAVRREVASRGLERLASLEVLLPAVAPGPGRTPRPAAALSRALGDRAVLSYFEADGELWVLAGGPVGTWTRIERPASEVAAAVDSFLTRLDDVDLAARLGAELLPEGSLPPPGETLWIVTDGALGRLPFAALRHGGRYIVERNPLTYVPSLEALAALSERDAAESGPALVLGDPLGDLPRAREEAVAVAARLGVAPHLGPAASRELLLSAHRPRLLHLAGHTGLGPRGPWIGLAGGPLSADALVAAAVAPRLAVLATCASAARPGREMWGSLGAVFLAAGSDAVLASLHSIPDEAAGALALAFYRHGGPAAPAEALALAQRELLGQGRPPAEWSPFVVMGLGSFRSDNDSHPTTQGGTP